MPTLSAPDAQKIAPESPRGPLDLELMDLYAAIFIVVPVALFLKSLWS